tara:strand:- start:41942 stop:42325 length:384 start_codon:yes stop_codon:yes gene_type:complete
LLSLRFEDQPWHTGSRRVQDGPLSLDHWLLLPDSSAVRWQCIGINIRYPAFVATIFAFSSEVFFLDISLHSITGNNIRYVSTDYDGSAVLRIDTITVPEPTNISLFILVGIFFSYRFYRQLPLSHKL